MNAAAALPQPLPADVRLMRAVANAVFVLAALAVVVGALWWVARLPIFAIRAIRIDGDVARNSATTIRANVAPKLKGSFFTLNLAQTRAAFEAVPWVRRAVVHRVWPDRLSVRLEEHRAAALWHADDGNDRLVNTQGEVFEANVGDVEDDALPTFSGAEGTSAHMLAMYQRLQPVFAKLDMTIDTLNLSGRGSWRVEFDSGADIELGRGTDDEVLARSERFVRTLTQVTQRYQRPLQYADLRHADGYAVKLKGITTSDAPAAGKKRN
ncbi:MAG TPA: cell division protein FtsQ/DivIB [Burkholderiaceae bacterium]|nr:cell division protein FtsQ/DivIB [Burkholderiaceae bacterium]